VEAVRRLQSVHCGAGVPEQTTTLMSADGAPAERAPLIGSDPGDADMGTADPNRLTLVDWAWLLVHAGCAGCDGLALQALLHRRFKGSLFFGGHTQFLGNWSLGLSLASHLLAMYAAAAVEPVPNPYRFNIRRHDHRERVYYWQSMVRRPPPCLRTALRGLAPLMVLRMCRPGVWHSGRLFHRHHALPVASPYPGRRQVRTPACYP